MSSEPIELTREERHAAREAFRNATVDDYGYGSGTAVDDIIAAVNGVRVGDPVGTIRRGSNGNIAVRVRVFNEYELPVERWVHVSTSSGVMARSDNDYVCDWPVIFTPDGAA